MAITLARQSDSANIRSSEGAGTTTLSITDNRFQVFNLSAGRTVTLPSTGVRAGDSYYLSNRTNNILTVNASGGSALTIANGCNSHGAIRNGYMNVMATQDAPTSPSHWQIVDLNESGTWSATVSNTSNFTLNSSIAHRYLRVLNQVSISGSLTGTTPSSGVVTFSFYLDLPVTTNFGATSDGYAAGTCLTDHGAGDVKSLLVGSVASSSTIYFMGRVSGTTGTGRGYNYSAVYTVM